MVAVALPVPEKPKLRGVLHQCAAVVAVIAGVLLLGHTHTTTEALACGVFIASLVTLFTVSATYHRVNWQPAARAWMRRADHSSIFVLIAGTYTPVALLGLPPETAKSVLLLAWGGAILGVLKSMFWIQGPKPLVAVLALLTGWSIAPYWNDVKANIPGILPFLLVGGIAYSIGAIAYATKKPALWPKTFGYHEFFHAGTLIGAGLHYVGVWRILSGLHPST
jgi:hemolysin III